jgi:hypothetical protein
MGKAGNYIHLQTTDRTNQSRTVVSMLLDTGATCNCVGERWAKAHKWALKALKNTQTVEVVGGDILDVTHYSERRIACKSSNGRVEDNERFLVIPRSNDIPLLGMGWIRTHKVNILWNKRILFGDIAGQTTPSNLPKPELETSPLADQRIFKARTRIIQGEIQSNEPPGWVTNEFAQVLAEHPETPEGLPPSRGELDYKIVIKPDFKPELEPGRRHFNLAETEAFAELAKQEEAAGRWEVQKHPKNVAEMLWAAKAGASTVKDKRPCIDYRHLNTGIQGDSFQLPLTKNQLHTLARGTVLTSMDIPKAYNQVLISDPETRAWLSFRCNGQVYSPTVMQFGSKTAVAHFQRFMTTILGDIVNKGCVVYLDNIVTHGATEQQQDLTLRACLTRLRNNHLNVKTKKCEWNKPVVQFCGFFVGGGKITLDPEKTRAIQEWPEPAGGQKESLKTQVREFLGFCNFYRDAFKEYSGMVEALTRLTSKTVEWTWGDTERAAFNGLKAAAQLLPERHGWNPEKPLLAYSDASDRACAMTFQQEDDDGTQWPIGFWSKKFDSTQTKWPTYDKEMAAVVWGLAANKEWVHCGLSGNKTTVFTDHKALLHWMDGRNTKSSRHQRWADDLLDYDNLQFSFVKGKDNGAADGLSRKDKGGSAKWEPTPVVPRDKVVQEEQVRLVRKCRTKHFNRTRWLACETCHGARASAHQYIGGSSPHPQDNSSCLLNTSVVH